MIKLSSMVKRFGVGLSLALACAVLAAPPAAFAADPSMHEIYQAAESGHLDQAQAMIGQVLANHPDSAKAHFVAAEIDARQGRVAGAREQLATAERLAPGLPFAKAQSVAALRAQLDGGSGAVRSGSPAHAAGGAAAEQAGPHFSWAPILIIALGVGLFMMWRSNRRTAAASYPAPSAAGPGYGPAPAPPAAPGGGLGSTVATGLAGGLAAGAGIVAGEALMHRFLDGGNGDRAAGGNSLANLGDPRGNADMGGEDFGVADSSWEDSSGGGDDWN